MRYRKREKIAQYKQVTEWFSIQTARMLDRMASIDEGGSFLLDNSLVLFGPGMKDGNVLESVNVPTALFGNPGGKMETGRHIRCKECTKLDQMHLSLLQIFGLGASDFYGVTDTHVPGLVQAERAQFHCQSNSVQRMTQRVRRPIHPCSLASPSPISAPQDQHNSKLPGFFSPQPEQSISTSLCSASRSAVSFMSCKARS